MGHRPRAAAVAGLALVILCGCGEDVGDDAVPFRPLPDPEPGNWLAFRADPGRTGHNPEADIGPLAAELWRVTAMNSTEYGAASSPSVYGDVLYVGSDTGEFRAFDRLSGELLWEQVIPETTEGIHGSPAISDGLVFIGAYNGTLYAFDRLTGEPEWTFSLGFQIGASPVVVAEHGRVYNTHERSDTGGGHVIAVDARSGDSLWVHDIDAHPHSSVALHLGLDMLYVGDNLALLHAFDARTGSLAWRVQLPQPNEDGEQSDIKSTPTVLEDRDLVVVGAWSKYVHAYAAADGALAWEYYAGARIMSSAAYGRSTGAVFVGTLSPDSALHAIDADSGEQRWRFETGSSILSSPALSGDESLLVVGSGDGNLYAVDSETGDLVWSHAIGGRVTGSPALVGNHVYVTSFQGDLVALETGP